MLTDPTGHREMMAPFLAAYFDEPLEEAHLLVLADWLEEHDRALTAALLRHALSRPRAGQRRDWSSEAAELALSLRRELGGRVHLQGDRFTLQGVPRRFRLGPAGIEGKRRDGAWTPVPAEAWTGGLLEAALFVLMLRLAISTVASPLPAPG